MENKTEKKAENTTDNKPDNQKESDLDRLLLEIQESAKYRHVSPDLIRRLGAHELALRKNLKEAVKETKNTLHQIAGAFLDRKTRYDQWLELLDNGSGNRMDFRLDSGNDLRETCQSIMANHASTRERLPLLETFYARTLERIQPIRSILDLCCGLNPLALPWMNVAPDVSYYACDLYGDMMEFLNGYFARIGINGNAWVCDVAGSPPTQAAQLALLLKALPPLEQTSRRSDAVSALQLLRSLNVEHILVSFPTRTLGGRNKQMGEHYEARFRALIAAEPWTTERFDFPNELCFLITK